MKQKKVIKKSNKIKKKKKPDLSRINLSFSNKNMRDKKLITIYKKKHRLKINKNICLKGNQLYKYLLTIGLEILEKRYGEVHEIFKSEGLLNEK